MVRRRPARDGPRRQVPVALGPGVGRLHGLDALERGDDVGHGWPAPGVAGQALVGELGGLERGLGRVLSAEALVHEARQLPAAGEVGPGPVHQVLLVARPVEVVRAQPRQQLQQHHAEAVHVALHVQVPRRHVLRRRVAVGADHTRRHVGPPRRRAVLRQPEVRQLRREVRVEEDVGRLEVPVDDLLLRRVQEGQPARRADGDLEPRVPCQRLGRTPPEEMVFQAAFGHELVHQEQLPVLAAVAQQPHQVGVRQSAQEVDLGLPLLQALDALRVELLDGDDDAGAALGRVERALVDPALVDPAEAALPEHHLRLEPLRRRPQLRERELPQPRRLEDAPRPRTSLLLRPAAVGRLRPCRRPFGRTRRFRGGGGGVCGAEAIPHGEATEQARLGFFDRAGARGGRCAS